MSFFRRFKKRNWSSGQEIYPDEILLDARNLPQFDRDQFEGRLEKPIGKFTIFSVGMFFALVALLFAGKIWTLQIVKGEAYAIRSEDNRLRHTLLFSDRGVIYDRNGELLAYNDIKGDGEEFAGRNYIDKEGFAHLLGYIKYPSKDSAGFYYTEDFEGVAGVEKIYNSLLAGKNGLKIIETNARGEVQSESSLEPALPGDNVTLSIDSRVQAKLYEYIKELADRVDFDGGGGMLMDIETGEMLALTNYPEYSSKVLTDGKDSVRIKQYVESPRKPFLNRVIDGLYTPGSIVKPFLALAALNEKIIDPNKIIVSTGSISVPNPYDPTKKTVFTDWKAHGAMDMRRAIGVSSNVYFYQIGGGFEGQKGLGIANIEKYMRMFGFGEAVGGELWGTKKGTIPNPEWKAKTFEDGTWRIGDTYNTAIGQYGFQVTPIQAVRAIAALANNGKLLTPTVLKLPGKEAAVFEERVFDPSYFEIVKDGMRRSVTEGTAKGLDIEQVTVAGKTGTAELGTSKKYVNSWVVGYFPVEKPRYAFMVMMERGPRTNTVGALYIMRSLLEWMSIYTPEYLQ